MMEDNQHEYWLYSYRTGSIEHAELYKRSIENILSNNFLSDLPRQLRNSFHSSFSTDVANLNDGIVLPIFKSDIIRNYTFARVA